MDKRGVEFGAYIEQYDTKIESYPMYIVKVDNVNVFAYSDEELEKFTKKSEDAQYIEIFEREDLQIIEKRLNSLELSILDYKYEAGESEDKKVSGIKKGTASKKKTADKESVIKPVFSISEEKDDHQFMSLQEVLAFVKQKAQKGIYIQRYKGLGEMNPQQLWDTTMDPDKRTLLQVTLEDAVETESIFSMLMGDEVAPRRAFIEQYAHEVQNLDV
jgi:DNA gyrase subunit B